MSQPRRPPISASGPVRKSSRGAFERCTEYPSNHDQVGVAGGRGDVPGVGAIGERVGHRVDHPRTATYPQLSREPAVGVLARDGGRAGQDSVIPQSAHGTPNGSLIHTQPVGKRRVRGPGIMLERDHQLPFETRQSHAEPSPMLH
jgi:hypothetical protein